MKTPLWGYVGWVVALLVLTVAACSVRSEPDWTALYSERIDQPVQELDASTLGQEYIDPSSGALTRTKLIPPASASSMKAAPKRTWFVCTDVVRRANACCPGRRRGTGRQRR